MPRIDPHAAAAVAPAGFEPCPFCAPSRAAGYQPTTCEDCCGSGFIRARVWTVDDYIREEVRRQGHDLTDPNDGGVRVQWMTNAWRFAEDCLARGFVTRPTLAQIVSLGCMIEPIKNAGGLRRVHVRVGNRLCPPSDQVPATLEHLCEHGDNLSPLDFYRELELIHPFVDGNGRTGKVVLNWISGTLSAPYFPPSDFWGTAILNP